MGFLEILIIVCIVLVAWFFLSIYFHLLDQVFGVAYFKSILIVITYLLQFAMVLYAIYAAWNMGVDIYVDRGIFWIILYIVFILFTAGITLGALSLPFNLMTGITAIMFEDDQGQNYDEDRAVLYKSALGWMTATILLSILGGGSNEDPFASISGFVIYFSGIFFTMVWPFLICGVLLVVINKVRSGSWLGDSKLLLIRNIFRFWSMFILISIALGYFAQRAT